MRVVRVIGAVVLAASLTAALVVIRFARAVVTPPKRAEYPLRIVAVDRVHQTVTLNDTAASRLPGEYGLWFGRDGGYLRFGNVLEARRGRVTRVLGEVISGSPHLGQSARETGWYFLGPWELDLAWAEVDIFSAGVRLPAWHISPAHDSSNWVIHVHGRTATRAETLRGANVASQAGWHSLLVSYRNDTVAGPSSDRRYGLGGTEWPDVVAAVRYAQAHGASRIVLMGWSMGALIAAKSAVQVFVQADAAPIVGLILESPALSWPSIIAHHARLQHLPAVAADGVLWLLQSRFASAVTGLAHPLQFRSIDGGNLIAQAKLPVLLLHSADDDYVPIEPSRQLAADLPQLVEFHEFAGAGHVRLWNADRRRWESAVTEWLTRHA